MSFTVTTYWRKMDPQPLLKKDFSNAVILPTFKTSFQETLRQPTCSKDVEEYILRNEVDEELKLKQNAIHILEIYGHHSVMHEKIQDASKDIMSQQGNYYIQKEFMENSLQLRESLQLQRGELFKNLHRDFVKEFGLLEYSDVLPSKLEQFLDFRYNKDMVCEKCVNKTHYKTIPRKRLAESYIEEKTIITEEKETETKRDHQLFRIVPNLIEFKNYEPGKIYTKTLRLINTSGYTQSLMLHSLPKRRQWLSVSLDINSKIAAGMSVNAKVTFKPRIYLNFEDSVEFRNHQGYVVTVTIRTSRDFPRLLICIFKSFDMGHVKPGSKRFLEDRREALNSTIDCGNCLVSQYIFLTIVVENAGMKGKFFLVTEDDWFHRDIVSVSSSMELTNENFWIYPTYFEIDTGDICEINLIFQPLKSGLQVEMLYLICDNNSYEQIELMGESLCFLKQFISIDVANEKRIEEKMNYCIFLGRVEKMAQKDVRFIINNNSVLHLNCAWEFSKVEQSKELYAIQEEWINVDRNPLNLPPNSETDSIFAITLKTETCGYHTVRVSMFARDIPLISLEEQVDFLVKDGNYENTGSKTLSHPVDVLITTFEIACFVDEPLKIEKTILCDCGDRCELAPRKPKMSLSHMFLNFGLLPSGLNIQKAFYVQNLTHDEIEWRIVEVKYRIDSIPYMETCDAGNVEWNHGHLHNYLEVQDNSYKIIDKGPMSWISFLVLFSVENGKLQEIEHVTVVIYEIIDYDISIQTGHSTSPILCPLQLAYVGIPIMMQFYIVNNSPITGCYYFLKPYGADVIKLSLNLEPSYGILQPHETVKITAFLTCLEMGIFEKFFVPCFIGLGRDTIDLRVLCAVDGIHLFFYLPDKKESFRKVMWPPKVIYEYDYMLPYCSCDEEANCFNMEESMPRISNLDLETTQQEVQDHYEDTEKGSNRELSSFTSSTSSCDDNHLVNLIKDEFGEDFNLAEDIVQVELAVKTPTKVTIYLENITPIETNFVIEAQNFYATKTFQAMQKKERFKTEDDKWNEIMATDHGIVVLPNPEKTDLPPFKVVQIEVWIYANTWGVYAEELLVDIKDVVTFSFSLIVNVIGSPIMFPMALNSMLDIPILRFGSHSYYSDEINRNVNITNTSSIPIKIIWRTFFKIENQPQEGSKMPFNLIIDILNREIHPERGESAITTSYHGMERTGLCDVIPNETDIMANETALITVRLNPQYFKERKKIIDVTCLILGHIYLDEKRRKKSNYFWRSTGPKGNQTKLEARFILEIPTLLLDTMYEETRLIIYANEVIFEKMYDHYEQLRFQNKHRVPCKMFLEIEEPFFVRTDKNKMCRRETFFVKAMDVLEVTINCYVDHQKIMQLANLIFEVENRPLADFIYCVDKENHIIDLRKKCKVIQNDSLVTSFPVHLFIHYPKIRVKPGEMDFETVMIGSTKKFLLTIFNQTGYEVKFEISKSKTAIDFIISPHYGTIAGSTGVNEAFVDIWVYFIPRESKAYQEALKVVTNIPLYFIEVHLKGRGSVNEKFNVTHMI